MPRLRNTGSGSVVNVDDETAARIIRGEFDMGKWERLDAAPAAPADDAEAKAPAVTTDAPAATPDAEAPKASAEADAAGAAPAEKPKAPRRRSARKTA